MVEFIGWTGVVVYVLAYALLSLRWLHADRITYHAMNAVGAICLVIFSYTLADQPNLVVNLAWMVIAVASMTRIVAIELKRK